MSNNKKYYYLKLKDNYFDSDEQIILESMPDGHLYSNILLKLYVRGLKNDGCLMFKDTIPYSATILAQVTRHPVGVVEKALDIFRQLGLVEVLDNGAIFLLNIQNFIGQSSTEADRIRLYDRKVKESKKSTKLLQDLEEISTPCEAKISTPCEAKISTPCEAKISTPEIRDRDKEIRDKEIEKVKNQPKKKLGFDFTGFNDEEQTYIAQWIQHKKEKRKAYTQTALDELRSQLLDWKQRHNLKQIILKSIISVYPDLYEPAIQPVRFTNPSPKTGGASGILNDPERHRAALKQQEDDHTPIDFDNLPF